MEERDVINSALGGERYADTLRMLSVSKRNNPRLHSDREGRKKKNTHLFCLLVSSRLFCYAIFPVSIWSQVFSPYLIYSPSSPTFFPSVSLSLPLSLFLFIGFTLCPSEEFAIWCFMLIQWLHLVEGLLSCFHFENWVSMWALVHWSVMWHSKNLSWVWFAGSYVSSRIHSWLLGRLIDVPLIFIHTF